MIMSRSKYTIIFFIIVTLLGCNEGAFQKKSASSYASWFSCLDSAVVIISPYTSVRDTIQTDRPMRRILCMSSSHVAALEAINSESAICAVSGLKYISSQSIQSLAEAGSISDIGYEASLDYEHILCLNPDIVLCYTTSASEPQYIAKLRSLGVRVAVLYDHVESHPLARAEYVRFFGALVSRRAEADSLFAEVESRYLSLKDKVDEAEEKVKVLLNIPYAGAWYVPGRENYMSRLVSDAGGEVLGSVSGAHSSVISLEKAYILSADADFWLNPGGASSLDELNGMHPSFKDFRPLQKSLDGEHTYIYNNTRRQNAGGGNDFWESGVVRPDLILEDLIRIMNPEYLQAVEGADTEDILHYYSALE